MLRYELTEKPNRTQIARRVSIGILCALASTLLVADCLHGILDAHQFDEDGEVGVGIVSDVDRPRRRLRRNPFFVVEMLTRGEPLSIDSQHGKLRCRSITPPSVGEKVRYIYSPSLQRAILLPADVGRGQVSDYCINRPETFVTLGIAGLLGYFAYRAFRWVYAIATKHYVIVKR